MSQPVPPWKKKEGKPEGRGPRGAGESAEWGGYSWLPGSSICRRCKEVLAFIRPGALIMAAAIPPDGDVFATRMV